MMVCLVGLVDGCFLVCGCVVLGCLLISLCLCFTCVFVIIDLILLRC